MLRKIRTTMISLLVLVVPNQVLAGKKVSMDQSDPIKVIQGIYGYYPDTEPMQSWHNAKLSVDAHELPYAPIFQKTYSLLMSKHNTDQDGGPCIDVNLICNCQDGTPTEYRIEQIAWTKNSRKYRVDLKGKDFSERHIFWSLRRIGRSWFVEDLGFSGVSDSTLSYMRSCMSPKKPH